MFSFPDYRSFARAFNLAQNFSYMKNYADIAAAPTERALRTGLYNIGHVGWDYMYRPRADIILNGGVYACDVDIGMKESAGGSLRIVPCDIPGSMPIRQALPWRMECEPRTYVSLRYERDLRNPAGRHTITEATVHDLTFEGDLVTERIARSAIAMFNIYSDALMGTLFAYTHNCALPAMPDAADLAWGFAKENELFNANIAGCTRPVYPNAQDTRNRFYNSALRRAAY